jgi:hypothetical protein
MPNPITVISRGGKDVPAESAAQAKASAIGNPLNLLKNLDPFKGLNLASWMLRIAEIAVGLVLVGIGVNSMLKGKPLAIVTGVAAKAAMA